MLSRVSALFFLFFIQLHSAQYLPSQHYTTAEGMSNNAIRSLFLDRDNVLWVGTENGVSRFVNGHFFNLNEDNGLGQNSCWGINQDEQGDMWFASYGGGVSCFDGKKFTIYNTKNGLPADKTRKVFPFKNKIYVGTELGVAIIDKKTGKVTVPKGIKPHFGVFIVSDFVVINNQVYFSAVNEGLFKVDESHGYRIVPVMEYEVAAKDGDNCIYSLGKFGNDLFCSDKLRIKALDSDGLSQNNVKSSYFGNSTIWQYTKDKRNTIYAAAWGMFKNNGGLYVVNNNQMKDVSDQYGIDSKKLLAVVYDKTNDLLYVGSKDKGLYVIRLDQNIKYNPFENRSIIDFENFTNQKAVLHNQGISFLDTSGKETKIISQQALKNKEEQYIHNPRNYLPKQEDGFYELDYSTPASEITFYNLVQHGQSLWVSTNIGLFEINSKAEIINFFFENKVSETGIRSPVDRTSLYSSDLKPLI